MSINETVTASSGHTIKIKEIGLDAKGARKFLLLIDNGVQTTISEALTRDQILDLSDAISLAFRDEDMKELYRLEECCTGDVGSF